MNQSIPAFAFATGMPVVLLILAAIFGGGWIAAALSFTLFITHGLDRLILPKLPALPVNSDTAIKLSQGLALAHWFLLILGIASLSGGDASALGKIGLFLALVLFFGQVSNSNAHELIHRSDRRSWQMGASVYTSLFFGHHTSAHLAVHHRFVGTPYDPNTAAKNETFYRFAFRAWRGSFLAGLRVENSRLAIKGLSRWHMSNPYWIYGGGGFAALLATGLVFGLNGMFLHIALGVFATLQLLLSDYVQHYGLSRKHRGDGTFEPFAPCHSWNAPHWFSSLLMLNAPRHSDHHKNPAKHYEALENFPADQAPVLPHSLPVMAAIALYPKMWRRVMKPHLSRWAAAEIRPTSVMP